MVRTPRRGSVRVRTTSRGGAISGGIFGRWLSPGGGVSFLVHVLVCSRINSGRLALLRGTSPLTRVAERSVAPGSCRLMSADAAAVRIPSVAITSAAFLSSASDTRWPVGDAVVALGAQPIALSDVRRRRHSARRVCWSFLPPSNAHSVIATSSCHSTSRQFPLRAW